MTEGVDSPSLWKGARLEGGEAKTKWNEDTNTKYLMKYLMKSHEVCEKGKTLPSSFPCHSDVSIGQETFSPPTNFILILHDSSSFLLYFLFLLLYEQNRTEQRDSLLVFIVVRHRPTLPLFRPFSSLSTNYTLENGETAIIWYTTEACVLQTTL